MEKVLIICNAPSYGDSVYTQSRAGVIDQLNAVAAAMAQLDIDFDTLTVRSLQHLAELLPHRSEKIIFNLVEEFPCSIKDACFVPALCAAFGKSCTGCDSPAMLLAQNKPHAKAVLAASSLPVPAGTVVEPGESFSRNSLPPGTYIVKPALADASEGITEKSIVQIPGPAVSELVKQIHSRFSQPAVIEQFIPARELNVSVLQQDDTVKVLPPAEIDFSAFAPEKPKIVDYDAKWITDSFAYNNTPRKIPADICAALTSKIIQLSLCAWRCIGCRDYARVDFRLDEKDNPYIIELNPNPDISPDAGFAAALSAASIPYHLFVKTVLSNAQHRLDNLLNRTCDSKVP